MKSFFSYLILFCLAGFLAASCQKLDLFEKNSILKYHRWPASLKPELSFTITDTSARYSIFVVVRHDDRYKYNNLWLNVYTLAPGDTAVKPQALELQLANNEQGWLGTGMDDIFEHRIRISQYPVPLKAGTYRFQLEQIMREDPLEHILNVGIRVERNPE